jgi:hypothetical protein
VWRQEVTHDVGGHTPSRQVRWVSESVWSERDRAVAVGLEVFERSLCPGCGRPIDEAWSPDAVDAHLAEPITCGPCAAIDRGREARRKQASNPDVHVDDAGVHWVAHRVGETPMSRLLREAAGREDT